MRKNAISRYFVLQLAKLFELEITNEEGQLQPDLANDPHFTFVGVIKSKGLRQLFSLMIKATERADTKRQEAFLAMFSGESHIQASIFIGQATTLQALCVSSIRAMFNIPDQLTPAVCEGWKVYTLDSGSLQEEDGQDQGGCDCDSCPHRDSCDQRGDGELLEGDAPETPTTDNADQAIQDIVQELEATLNDLFQPEADTDKPADES